MTLALVMLASRSSAQETGDRGKLTQSDRTRVAEALALVEQLGERVWPGWGKTAMPVLLVTDSSESRGFSPTMLATFPIDGVPTIVAGPAERTGKSSTQWVLSLVHEHFHQWQYALPGYYTGVAGLGLSNGDSTGMWMLNYPFPYDSAPVARALRRWALSLRHALDAPRLGLSQLEAVVSGRDGLRSRLSAADHRYLEFQLWQEGVARYIEYRAAELAAKQRRPLPDFEVLPDYQSYGAAAIQIRRSLLRELERLDPGKDKRVSFYPIGAAIALLLDQTRPGWKQDYSQRPFSLAALLPAGSR